MRLLNKQKMKVMAAKNKSKEIPAEASPVAGGPSKAMLALLGGANTDKMKRMNMPAMVKPSDVPVGSAISGVIKSVHNSQVSTVKGKLLWMQHESGAEFTFPATGVIRNALAPGVDGEKELTAALEKFVGKTLVAKRLDDKTSAKYKKAMFMFDVFIA